MQLNKKDEVRIKEDFLTAYGHVDKLDDPFEDGSKVGRVIRVDGDFAEVDFYNSSPAKFTVKLRHMEVVSKVEDRVDVAAEPIGNIEAPPLTFLSLEDGKEREHKPDSNVASLFKKEEVIEKAKEAVSKSKNGALRANQGKLPIHLVPPDAIKAMAAVLEVGAKKYALRNWEKGAEYSVPYASLLRHLLAFWSGEDNDPESGLPHTYHVLMNAAMLVRYEQMEGLDDRP